MADEQINIAIKSSFDATGAAAAKVAVGQIGDAATKADRDLLGYARSVAAAQRAQGDIAGSAATLSSALGQVDTSSKEAQAAIAQLHRTQQTGVGVAQQFGDSLKDGMLSVIGPAALATAAIAGATRVAGSFVEAFNFKADLDAGTTAIKSQLEGFRNVNATYAEAIEFGRRYQITQQQTNDILGSSTDILRTSKASVSQLEEALIRLQSRDVSKPISEAARALRELSSGDVTSIKELFNVPAKDALRMRDEIVAGGDAVLVLTKYLNDAKVGMGALEQRTQGTKGKMNELALAQEDLKQAQAAFSEGPGLKLLEAQTRATVGVTRVLSGDFDSARQSIANAANEGSFGFQLFNTIMGGTLEKIARYQNAQEQSNVVVGQKVAITMRSADADDRAAESAAKNTAAVAESTTKMAEGQAAAVQMADAQAQLDRDSKAAAVGLLGAGDQAELLAAKYGIAKDAAQRLINAQQQLANGAALKEQRAGERSPGASGRAETDAEEQRRLQRVYADLDKSGEAAAAAEQARRDQVLQTGTARQKIAEREKEYAAAVAKYGKGSAEAIRAETELIQAKNAASSAYNGTLNKQLGLQERIYDTMTKQLDAQLALAELQIRDRQMTREEDEKLKIAQRILASPNASADMKARAADAAALIEVQRAKRQQEINKQASTANATVINGKAYQSVPGSASASPAGLPPPSGAGAPIAAPNVAAPASGGSVTVINQLVVDGKVAAEAISPYLWDQLLRAGQTQAAQRGI